jgi:DNA (cytosine-5)-methyltransferase 1
MGYHQAGFEVVGVDINPQPRYPFEFHQGDALEYARLHGHEFDAIHASPPCQKFSAMTKGRWQDREHPDLIEPTRDLLIALGKPFIIENVPGAPLHNPVMLCGSMFQLRSACGAELRRHRYFELSFSIGLVPPCQHGAGSAIGVYGGGQNPNRKRVIGVYGGHGRDRRRVENTQDFSVEARREAMGIDWMTGAELSQAIPPAYTKFIGEQLLEQIRRAA